MVQDWLGTLNRISGRLTLPEGGRLEILNWSYQAHLRNNQPHRHTYFEICLVGGYGSGVFVVEQKKHPIGPGDLFLARPGVVHQIINTAEPLMELYWVSFQGAPGSGGIFSRFALASEVLVVPDSGNRVGSIWKALQAVATAPFSASEAQLQALMTALLLGILQMGSGEEAAVSPGNPTDTGAQLAHLALRYIHDNLNRPLSVAEVANYLHLSPRHLTRLITAFTGVPPAAYLEQARIDRARALLRRSDLPLKQVALEVGYRDVQHFTRAFARAMGVPPGAFRRGVPLPFARSVPSEGALV